MAQTTHLASLGPLSISLFVVYLVDYNLIYIMKDYLVSTNMKKIIKKLTYGPNDARRIVWAINVVAVFHRSPWSFYRRRGSRTVHV